MGNKLTGEQQDCIFTITFTLDSGQTVHLHVSASIAQSFNVFDQLAFDAALCGQCMIYDDCVLEVNSKLFFTAICCAVAASVKLDFGLRRVHF